MKALQNERTKIVGYSHKLMPLKTQREENCFH